MNANELRIGNILNGGIVVQSIDDCGVNTGMQNSCLLSNLHPIPLTPEILKKCGFKLQNPLGLESSNTWFKEGMNEFLSYHFDGYWIYQSTKPRIINYVHQLQNLYFALTGEELQINLNEQAPIKNPGN